jgi:hypothetical protein
MRVANTASGWRMSIIESSRARKKSSVAIGVALQNSQELMPIGINPARSRYGQSPRTASVHAALERFAGPTTSHRTAMILCARRACRRVRWFVIVTRCWLDPAARANAHQRCAPSTACPHAVDFAGGLSSLWRHTVSSLDIHPLRKDALSADGSHIEKIGDAFVFHISAREVGLWEASSACIDNRVRRRV